MKAARRVKSFYSLRAICLVFGKSRQAYYKLARLRAKRQDEEDRIIELVQKERKILPYLGGRKLYFKLRDKLKTEKIHVGRDKLFEILRRHGELVVRKRRFVKTTNSSHTFRRYKDIFNGTEISAVEQAFVSDITYIPMEKNKFAFAAFVTDAYSRKIMGYSVGDKIDTALATEALIMALNSRRFNTELMHHSDRDGRYCSTDYIRLLKAYGIGISMTETSDPRDNAIAERLNGIIKQEFGLKRFSGSLEELTRLLDEAVYLYNTYRPHMSCNYKTPEETHSPYPVPTTMLPGNMTSSDTNQGTLV